jgi:hypothetical protein
VRNADFRINPEHPPLVKLWVGSLIPVTGFRLNGIRPFADKADECDFAEQDVYLNNDFNSVQRRARIAMWMLNALLLVALVFAVRRAFGPGVALGTLLFLAIDPTVAAHLPVVMTDLPVSLLSATAVVLAIRAFQDWAWGDLVACSMALGLALSTKHSAPIFFIFAVLTGAVLALVVSAPRPEYSRLFRFAKLSAVVVGALIVLWGFYFFRFAESNTEREVFNRPLADKIGDVQSPAYRFVLTEMASSRVVPRAYYHRVLEPAGEVPLYAYRNGANDSELEVRHVDWLGRDPKLDEIRLRTPVFSGTVMIKSSFLAKQPFWDSASLRDTVPSTRFGNLLIFRGTCACGSLLAPGFYFDAESKIHTEKPDFREAEQLLKQSIALDPSAFFTHIELGNLLLKRGAREDASRAYSEALLHAPNDAVLRHSLEEQIKRVSSEPLDRIPELRNPFLE